jgi:hypothetical protein
MCVESSATTNTTYTLTAEQDNWVFAPEGGIGMYEDGKEPVIFFTSDIIRAIVEKYYLNENTYGGGVYVDFNLYFSGRMNEIAKQNTCENPIYEALSNSFQYGDNCDYEFIDSLNQYFGEMSLALLAVPEGAITKVAGAVFTVASYLCSNLSKDIQEQNSEAKMDLIDALYTGNLSIIYDPRNLIKIEYNEITTISDNWDPWITPKFINKYRYFTIDDYTVKFSMRLDISRICLIEYTVDNNGTVDWRELCLKENN